jgi:peroxiredoxin
MNNETDRNVTNDASGTNPPDAAGSGAHDPGVAPPEPGGHEGGSAEDGPPRGRKRWIVAAMAALAVALFTVPLLQGPDVPAAGDVASSAGTGGDPGTCTQGEGAANFDFTMKDIDGADVKLSDYRGKVILLNFWATWCAPCKVEIPEFVEVYHEYKDRGFEILGVLSMDDPSQDDLKAFASMFKMEYPVFRANEDFANAHGPIWALPTSYIIDRRGSICTKHVGPVSRETVEREIKGLL